MQLELGKVEGVGLLVTGGGASRFFMCFCCVCNGI